MRPLVQAAFIIGSRQAVRSIFVACSPLLAQLVQSPRWTLVFMRVM
jgi:hypothetical protein